MPETVRDWVVARAAVGGIDWARTPGFAPPTGGEGYVRLNLAGREARGCLGPGSDRLRRYLHLLREGFGSLRVAGTNEPLVRDMVSPAERFPGPRAHYLPDNRHRLAARLPGDRGALRHPRPLHRPSRHRTRR
jgi:hypothetical protein